MAFNVFTSTKAISWMDAGHEVEHIFKRMNARQYSKFQSDMNKTVIVKRGTTKVSANSVDIIYQWWKNLVEKVTGYCDADGKDIMENSDWKNILIEQCPDHCVKAFNAMVSTFAPDIEGAEVPFQEENSEQS